MENRFSEFSLLPKIWLMTFISQHEMNIHEQSLKVISCLLYTLQIISMSWIMFAFVKSIQILSLQVCSIADWNQTGVPKHFYQKRFNYKTSTQFNWVCVFNQRKGFSFVCHYSSSSNTTELWLPVMSPVSWQAEPRARDKENKHHFLYFQLLCCVSCLL